MSDSYAIIARKLIVTVGTCLYIVGTIGNICNIYVFFKWVFAKKSRHGHVLGRSKSNTPLYLLLYSIGNLLVIIFPLLVRIIFDGYEYPITKANSILTCKLRFYILHGGNLISLACICLATLDRYLVSSPKVFWRQLSPTRKRTKQIITIIVCFCCLHGIPILIYYDEDMKGHCVIVSQVYVRYYTIVILVLLFSIIPIIFLIIFGVLTFLQLKNMRHQRTMEKNGNRNFDQQTSRMLILICVTLILSSIPYGIDNVYISMIMHKKPVESSVDFLYQIIAIVIFYIHPVSSCYIFLISTPNFRMELLKLIVRKDRQNRFFQNQIQTTTSTQVNRGTI